MQTERNKFSSRE